MPPTKTWKSRERQIAARFGSKRTPLSGGNSGHTRSDSLSDVIFLEDKHRKRHAVISLWDKTKKLAEKEGKTPVIALTQHGRRGFWIMCHVDDLQVVAAAERVDSEDAHVRLGGSPEEERPPVSDNRIVSPEDRNA